MSKRTVFTSITPLPPGISRQAAIDFLHNHRDMIDLNPLVTDRHIIPPPSHALPEEHVCTWYSITDKISYLPGGLVTGAVSYTAAFHDLPTGLQTHCHAPMGVDLREKWSVAGSEPGEDPEPMELGLGAPRTGLYIREDVIITCNMVMAGFIKKTIKKAHGVLIDAIALKAAGSNPLLQASHTQERQQQALPPLIQNKLLTKPLPARPISWQTPPPRPAPASLTTNTYQTGTYQTDTYQTDTYQREPYQTEPYQTEVYQYETGGMDRGPHYGYVEDRMGPRTMTTKYA
ncbi:hypothetical protein TGAMA5MH_01182 [Trichoderma gamsii]|uniref:DUF7053 domain-containing protein n=1 Tax=Trichoderma gamsii TaxID=398673 RepID=A0A2K0TPB7_9HYPO|nr:hypothetical protein TGAMA5MH_01182 [Trichoderma gamsii]